MVELVPERQHLQVGRPHHTGQTLIECDGTPKAEPSTRHYDVFQADRRPNVLDAAVQAHRVESPPIRRVATGHLCRFFFLGV